MKQNMTFEQALERLGQVTEEMESASIPLAELSSLYKEGLELYRFCQEQLDLTEKELLTLSEENNDESE